MKRNICTLFVLVVISVAFAVSVSAEKPSSPPGKPNFSEAIYADDETWGTKVTTTLPAPNDYNRESFDVFYVITNGPEGQLPVGEAAPTNPDYNGGRWFTHTVEWTQNFLENMNVPILKSAEDVIYHQSQGHLVVTEGSFPDGPPVYFQCPLLPVKDE